MSSGADKERDNDLNPEGRWQLVVRWLAANWRALVSELVSTTMLLGLGCASCLPTPNRQRAPAPLMHPAMSFGFLVVALCVAFDVPSGCHMNPAVSLAAVVMRRLSPALALAYSAAQVAGATLGYVLLAALAPAARQAPMGMTLPAEDISTLGALLLELAMTALLVMTVCALWVSPPDPTGPIKVGLLVGGLTLAGGWMSGTSLNPARSIGPAIYHNYWTDHWIYWVGPLGGALAGVALHVTLHPHTAPCRRPRTSSLAGPAPPEMLRAAGRGRRPPRDHQLSLDTMKLSPPPPPPPHRRDNP